MLYYFLALQTMTYYIARKFGIASTLCECVHKSVLHGHKTLMSNVLPSIAIACNAEDS